VGATEKFNKFSQSFQLKNIWFTASVLPSACLKLDLTKVTCFVVSYASKAYLLQLIKGAFPSKAKDKKTILSVKFFWQKASKFYMLRNLVGNFDFLSFEFPSVLNYYTNLIGDA
jgi:hypothetical protein